MSEYVLSFASWSETASLLLVDSAIKGGALLGLAGIATLILRRDSAATRHLVWLVAIIAILLVPLISALLPDWRVLPSTWNLASQAMRAPSPVSFPPTVMVEQRLANRDLAPANTLRPALEAPMASSAAILQPPVVLPAGEFTQSTTFPVSEPAMAEAQSRSAVIWIAPVWTAIAFLFALRLIGSWWLLCKRGRRSELIALWRPSRDDEPAARDASAPTDSMGRSFHEACRQLSVDQSVRLLVHTGQSIPMVWGIARPRLLLPAESKQWDQPRLRSVLLHELSHVKRRDTLAQLLTQSACALYWFNPLVWFAAWRLHVERERASDNLVLASGIRASTYAQHLLDIATRLSPSKWNAACGLAMARSSSLEGRLGAILSAKPNRRSVTRAIFAAITMVGAGVAIPLAMLRAAEGPLADAPRSQSPASTSQDNAPTSAAIVASDLKPKYGRPQSINEVVERELRWGKPVDGLRASLTRLSSVLKPNSSTMESFDLIVQNVSDAPIRLIGNADAPNPRTLRVRQDGTTLMGLQTRKPSNVNYLLKPREIVVLPMFPPERDDIALLAKDPTLTFYAIMQIDQASEGAWTGKLITGETELKNDVVEPAEPQAKSSRALLEKWRQNARGNGMIPGGALRSLAKATTNFIKFNPEDKRTPALTELLGRMDVSHDWSEADVIDLLDNVTDVYDSLPTWAMELGRFELSEVVRTGQPLPAEFEKAPWGDAQPNGLRTAWLLDPSIGFHALGTSLRSSILFHNAGKDTVVFRALSWYQSSRHQARDANGTTIPIRSTQWTTIPQVFACRLLPGEYIEVGGAGIGVGKDRDQEDWQGIRVGSWIDAKAADEITFTPAPVSVDGNDAGRVVGESPWWLNFIKDRLERDAPLPDDNAERKRLLHRAAKDLFGTPPTPEEIKTFVADRSPGALSELAKRLAAREGTVPFSGTVQSGETDFLVLGPDPNATTKPRIAASPGRYTLGDQIRLIVERKIEQGRFVNTAQIVFYKANPKAELPGPPHAIPLPDGYQTWAIAWQRGETVLWVAEKGAVRSYDFSDAADVKEATIDGGDVSAAPKSLRDVLGWALRGGSESGPGK